jgi:hypothetical protein
VDSTSTREMSVKLEGDRLVCAPMGIAAVWLASDVAGRLRGGQPGNDPGVV